MLAEVGLVVAVIVVVVVYWSVCAVVAREEGTAVVPVVNFAAVADLPLVGVAVL